MSGKRFLIFSHRWRLVLGCPMWWRAGARGYTHDLENAGRFSEAEAKRVSEYSGAESEVVEFGSERFKELSSSGPQKGSNLGTEKKETD